MKTRLTDSTCEVILRTHKVDISNPEQKARIIAAMRQCEQLGRNLDIIKTEYANIDSKQEKKERK